jgi:cysteine synthase
MNLISQ